MSGTRPGVDRSDILEINHDSMYEEKLIIKASFVSQHVLVVLSEPNCETVDKDQTQIWRKFGIKA